MLTARRPQRGLAAARFIFSSAAITVGSLYLVTLSVAVTIIGTAARFSAATVRVLGRPRSDA